MDQVQMEVETALKMLNGITWALNQLAEKDRYVGELERTLASQVQKEPDGGQEADDEEAQSA